VSTAKGQPWVARLPVRFQDVDGAGIVFYPRFFSYFHAAFEDFFGAETGTPYHVWIGERRIGWPTVHIDADFRSPLEYGMQVEIALSFAQLGRSSFRCHYDARTDAGQVACACDITVVTVNLDRMESIEIPPELRPVLERHAG
jgi:4-hydroxybenzoyl-CoA thioesterase